MKRSRSRVIPILWVVGLCAAAVTAMADDYPVTRGRQVIINRGIQLQSIVLGSDGVDNTANFTDFNQWQGAGFTTFNFWNQTDPTPGVTHLIPTVVPQLKQAGQQWGKIWGDPPPTDWPDTCAQPAGVDALGNGTLSAIEQGDAANLVDLQWSDERRDEVKKHLCSIASLFRIWNHYYPQALAHTNFCEGTTCSTEVGDDALTNYIAATQPDILTFDQYPPFSPGGGDFNSWYAAMQKYRMQALAGYALDGGANSGPLPYGQFLRTFRGGYTGENSENANESFINLQHFASLAFGYTWLSSFIYTAYTPAGQPLFPALFDSGTTAGTNGGDTNPDSAVFGFEQQANSQTLNLGNYFKRAVSTHVFYIPDSNNTVAPFQVPQWTPKSGSVVGADDYVASITPYTNSTANGGVAANSYGHAIVGYFMPLQYMHDIGRAFANGLHFMIVNGSAGSGTADSHGQWYHVVLDFTGTSNNSLLRLSRTTGHVELVPLVAMGNSHYYLDLYLPGGIGDVFTFWNSSLPVPGMQDKQINIVPIITTLLH
jgi:hypothetical protein